MRDIIKYETYKKLAVKYVIEEYGNLDVLKNNLMARDKILAHMSSMLRSYCPSTAKAVQAAMNENKRHFHRFIEEHMDF